jgi:predicted pyridoxine 5'-phosphate oxidase superfamily flavin-nucleotide-binding protein
VSRQYGHIAFTPGVDAEQDEYGSAEFYRQIAARGEGLDTGDRLGPRETSFLRARDSFYLATVGETGWPYVQFRGGPPGFVHVPDSSTIAWADYRGNLQHVSTGNLRTDDRVALIAVDYPRRSRLKLFGKARVIRAEDDPDLIARLATDVDDDAVVERAILVDVTAYDWNCPQHIRRRFTEQEIAPLVDRIGELEAELARLKRQG